MHGITTCCYVQYAGQYNSAQSLHDTFVTEHCCMALHNVHKWWSHAHNVLREINGCSIDKIFAQLEALPKHLTLLWISVAMAAYSTALKSTVI